MQKIAQPKIVLISPQTVGAKNQIRKAQPPLGVAYLAAALEHHGFKNIGIIDAVVEDYDNVEFLDDNNNFVKYGLSDNDMVKRLKAYQPDIVGISVLFSSQAECAYSLARNIKESYDAVPIMLGGIHASYTAEAIIKEHREIDFVITGEAEKTIVDFITAYFGNGEYTQVPGLLWRGETDIKYNQRAPFISNLDTLPFPAWHRMNMERYFEISMPHNPFVKSGRVGSIMTSRGCPFSCYFCSSSDFAGHAFRAISSKRVIEMVAYLVDRFQIKELQILDDTFTTNFQRVLEICKGIKSFNLRISLPNSIRADWPRNRHDRFTMFTMMREAGVEQIGIAAEHGDQEFLDNVIGKKLDLTEVPVTCDLAHKAGLLVHAAFMMGFPFENKDNRQKTMDCARSINADSFAISLAAPLPGTKLWDIVESNNLFMETFNVDRIVYVNVNIKPYDISPEDLYSTVDALNRELNEAAQKRNPAAREKYKLFEGKNAQGDRKYYFSK
jgi:radical SAM superfamily enzyme YgiQ (UPF0313 family)